MNFLDVVKYYGGTTSAARELGCAKQTVDGWKHTRIPSRWQAKIAAHSAGALVVDRETRRDAELYRPLIEARST